MDNAMSHSARRSIQHSMQPICDDLLSVAKLAHLCRIDTTVQEDFAVSVVDSKSRPFASYTRYLPMAEQAQCAAAYLVDLKLQAGTSGVDNQQRVPHIPVTL
jgi:hypothetical protein